MLGGMIAQDCKAGRVHRVGVRVQYLSFGNGKGGDWDEDIVICCLD
jgi:hypothetical protein